jgi:hypothetical protein
MYKHRAQMYIFIYIYIYIYISEDIYIYIHFMYADMNIYIDNYTLIQTYLYLYIDDDTLDPVGAFMSHGMHIIYAINVYVYIR